MRTSNTGPGNRGQARVCENERKCFAELSFPRNFVFPEVGANLNRLETEKMFKIPKQEYTADLSAG